jgi:hypothetical protein
MTAKDRVITARRRAFSSLAAIALSLAPGAAQRRFPGDPPPDEPNRRLPGGKDQREEILKEDHRRNLEDAAGLMRLSEEVKADLEKSDRYIVSVDTLKKLDQIEKLSRSIRSRLKRY